MKRVCINLLVIAGYLVGLVLVWFGFEMLAFHSSQTAEGVFCVCAGLACWCVLSYFVRLSLRRRSGAAADLKRAKQ